MRPTRTTPVRVALVAATLVLAACARDAAAPGTEPLDDAEALQIGREIAAEVQGMANSFGLDGLLGPSLPGFGLDPRPHPRPGVACPMPDQFPPTDSDGDGVPDELTLTFTEANCTFSARDGATLVITGMVVISDPTAPPNTAFGFRVVVTDLLHKLTRADGSFVARELDGVVQVVRSATEFSALDQTTATHESSEGRSSQLEKDWAVTFVADEGQTLAGWRHLPSGTLTINGSTIRTRGDHVHALAIATDATAPLHFDATCEADQKFDAGVLVITRTRGEERVTITVTFTGCGEEPIIEVQRPPGA